MGKWSPIDIKNNILFHYDELLPLLKTILLACWPYKPILNIFKNGILIMLKCYILNPI